MGKIPEAQISNTPIQVALPTPILFMIFEAKGKEVKAPKERQKIAIPKLALSMSKFSLTVGM